MYYKVYIYDKENCRYLDGSPKNIYSVEKLFEYLDFLIYQDNTDKDVMIIKRIILEKRDEILHKYYSSMPNALNQYEEFKFRELEKQRIEDVHNGKQRR